MRNIYLILQILYVYITSKKALQLLYFNKDLSKICFSQGRRGLVEYIQNIEDAEILISL